MYAFTFHQLFKHAFARKLRIFNERTLAALQNVENLDIRSLQPQRKEKGVQNERRIEKFANGPNPIHVSHCLQRHVFAKAP